MDSSIECLEEVDNADKQLVESIKLLLCEIRGAFSPSGVKKLPYTVYLTDPSLLWPGDYLSSRVAVYLDVLPALLDILLVYSLAVYKPSLIVRVHCVYQHLAH